MKKEAVQDAADVTKSHKERILAYLSSRQDASVIKLNDFLKSLWPVVPNHPLGHTIPENMKKLRATLRELSDSKQVAFVNDSFTKLARPYWPDSLGKTHYYDLNNVTIEVEIPQIG